MKLGMMLEVDKPFTMIWLSRSGDDLSPLWGLFYNAVGWVAGRASCL